MKKKSNSAGYAYHRPAPGADDPDAKAGDKGDEHDGCCSLSCLQFSLHLFNVLFFLSGVVLVSVGVRTLVYKHPALVLLSSGLYDLTGYVIVGAGCVILVASILGCIGLCRGSHKQVMAYATVLGLIFALEVGAGALAYIYKGRVGNELEQGLRGKFTDEYGVNNETTAAVDELQISLSCCGIHSFEDWRNSTWWGLEERRNNKVPDSCCITPGKYCGVRDHPSNIRYTGCIDRIHKIAGDNLLVIGAVSVGICLIQLVGLVLACFLHSKLKALVYYG